jgi:hypothetical protein
VNAKWINFCSPPIKLLESFVPSTEGCSVKCPLQLFNHSFEWKAQPQQKLCTKSTTLQLCNKYESVVVQEMSSSCRTNCGIFSSLLSLEFSSFIIVLVNHDTYKLFSHYFFPTVKQCYNDTLHICNPCSCVQQGILFSITHKECYFSKFAYFSSLLCKCMPKI